MMLLDFDIYIPRRVEINSSHFNDMDIYENITGFFLEFKIKFGYFFLTK